MTEGDGTMGWEDGGDDDAVHGEPALAGLRVLDVSTVFAGPLTAMHLGDAGAEVIKIEHPRRPDPARGHGPSKDGHNLWWVTLGRNKRLVQLNLSTPGGAEVFRQLACTADVLIENFRPGTLERWGIGPDVLTEDNPRLVVARVTGFGQVGPYRRRPGFGTLAEAMSGFAALTGEPDGPPTLPAFGLADGIASLACAYAVMVALHERERSGRGQVVDLAIIEPIMAMLGPQLTRWDQAGTLQPRTGNRSTNNAPRNTYLTGDGRWVAVSTSAQSIAERVMVLVGRKDMVSEPWFSSGAGRVEHGDEIDEAVSAWVGQRSLEEVLAEFERADAAVAPVYDASDIMADEHFHALGTIRTMQDPHLGPVAVQGPLFRMSRSPSVLQWTGREPGADQDEVLHELGYSDADIAALRERGAW
jgi:crotonobetainyl-CoA:carnitine CoA-transferase CaiB-like acyl-CoA transferase